MPNQLKERTELFTQGDVVQGSSLENYEGKFLVLSVDSLGEGYRTPDNQIWKATGGFGCDPTKMGTAVMCISLADGEHVRWSRRQFIGVLKDELVQELELDN